MGARALLLLSLLLWPTAAAAAVPAYDTCDAAVETALSEAGVEPSRVRSVYTSPKLDHGRTGTRVLGLEVWVRLADCSGAVVLELTPACALEQVYSRGECQVPGIELY